MRFFILIYFFYVRQVHDLLLWRLNVINATQMHSLTIWKVTLSAFRLCDAIVTVPLIQNQHSVGDSFAFSGQAQWEQRIPSVAAGFGCATMRAAQRLNATVRK